MYKTTKMQEALRMLMEKKPFYANFFLMSRIAYDTHGVQTAAACLTNTGPMLIFNREFLSTKTCENICGIIEHEILHLLFEHVKDMKTTLYHNKIANIAMDLSINQYISGLPDGCVTLDSIEKLLQKKVPARETWEFYYGMLMEKAEELAAAGVGTLDDHEVMGDMSDGEGVEGGVDPALGKEILRSAIDKAAKASAGNVPGEVMKVFDSLRSQSKLPWQSILSNFIARATSSTTKFTRKKLHRRFDESFPGKKKKRELVLAVCVDSSGSVSDDSYDQFMAEIMRMSAMCSKVYFIEADCVVQKVSIITKTKKPELSRTGYGGTAYQPAIDESVKLGADAIIYFGDFDTADKPQDPGKPFLWVGVGNSPKPGDFGGELRL